MKTLFSAKDEHRQASWLELFFDLVFVAVIDLLADNLSHIKNGVITIEQIAGFILSFIPLWWIWATHTLFSNRFEQDTAIYKIHTLLIMGLLIVLSSSSASHQSFNFFTFIYCAIRLLLAAGYFVIYKKRNNYKKFTYKMTIYILTGVLISLSALFFENENIKILISFSGIALEMILHVIACHKNIIFSVHRKHLVERVGILTVIILGQTVVSILTGISHYRDLSVNAMIATCTSFVFIAALWTVYFGSLHLLEKAQRIKNGITLIYFHLSFYIGLIILACMIRHAIMQDINKESFLLLAMVGMPAFYFGRQMIYFISYPVKKTITITIICSLISIFITFISAEIFDNTAYAISGMAFGMLVYLLLVKKWVIRYKHLLFKYMD